MTTQNYLLINQSTNIVDNVVIWDGNTQTWKPPIGYLPLIQSTTNSLNWSLNSDKTDWILIEFTGGGQIGFTWNGTVLTTNQPKPPKPTN